MALSEGEARLAQKEQETAAQIKDGEENLAEGREKLLEGETEYADGKAEYEENLADFNETIAEEEQKIADIDMTQWYVQDRTSLSGYANVKSDAASIEAIGTVFPMVFFRCCHSHQPDDDNPYGGGGPRSDWNLQSARLYGS